MNRKTLPIIISTLLYATASVCSANPDLASAETLDRIRVQGERIDVPAQAKQRLEERAGATAVIDSQSYRQQRVSTLSDALGYAAGVFVQPRFGAEEARIAIRGSGLQRTFHGRGLIVLQDGVPINLADGGFDMQSIEPLSTSHIEVWRGPNALEYGAASLGGAINFVTPTGSQMPGLQLRAEAGSFDYGRWQAQWGGAVGAHDGIVSLSGFAQDSYRDNARQENHRLFGNYGYRFNDALELRTYLAYVDTRSALPGLLTLAQFEADPSQAAGNNIRLDQRRDFELTRLSTRLTWQPDDKKEIVASVFVSDKKLDHPIFQVLLQESQDIGIDLRGRFESSIGEYRNVLTVGVGIVDGDTRDDRFINLGRLNPDDHRGASTDQSDQKARNLSAFIENQLYLSDQWSVSVGGQGVRAQREFIDRFPTPFNASFDKTYSRFSPKIGTRFIINDDLNFYANISDSFEPPSFGELTGGPTVTQVDAQRARSGEIGLRLSNDRFDIDATIYRANVRKELLSLTDGLGNPRGTVNADRTIHQGIELSAQWQIAEQWQLMTNYLLNDFTFDGDATFADNDLAGVPPQQLRAMLRFAPNDYLSIAPTIEWTPQDYFIDHANTFKAPGYSIWGIKLFGQINPSLSWFVDGRNLGNKAYVATTGVVADTRAPINPANPSAFRPARDGAYFLPGDGRSVYAGISWKF